MSEQGEKTCAALCEKVVGLPDKAREALLNIAEGIYIGMKVSADSAAQSAKQAASEK